jgi:ankyrin repeat protein
VVQLLLATGKVQLNARDKSGMTPLMWAAKLQRTPVVKLLLSTGQVHVDFDLRELRKGTSIFGSREEPDLSLLELLNAYKRDNP